MRAYVVYHWCEHAGMLIDKYGIFNTFKMHFIFYHSPNTRMKRK
jgi:hypothetical protein